MNDKMKMGWVMLVLSMVFFCGSLTSGLAQNHTVYRIKKADHLAKGDPLLSNFTYQMWVSGSRAWLQGQEQIAVRLTVLNDVDTSGVYLKVYYFDDDHNLVASQDKAADFERIGKAGRETIFITPQSYQHDVEVFAQFPVPTAAWKYAVVVFGDATTATAYVIPGGVPSDFPLPEKDQLDAGS